ncbi:hypothetical protein P0O24_03985 [Methanotrichaceae archaeon M04Ac]|uniref:Tubulin/FtsZ GTPase domain-containing protein n=1 Tax=Candidatus Methanocrinis alkalitolerans TaxID=3033395 RepID=A0ABT5XDG1_9EURY|nr:hypothetical protein [Candidatus Methanocrinis alkalitolerans]MCR3884150.1 hypothetical protein [Methanothrix sp.]MDF0592739.1 hypothetical protein [Candidatus Methanocrinis alkalitolerans]
MRLCIVGIGGCGGHLAERFLQNQDVALLNRSLGEHVSFGGVKGLWLEADVQETQNQKFFGSLDNGCYPGFFIPHDVIGTESKTSKLIVDRYGYDVKKQGFMRQAEFLKAVFEIFGSDGEVKRAALSEYDSENPILRGAWDKIRGYTTLAALKGNSGSEMCDGILFIVSLGGGTGTGFVNPITRYIRGERPAYPVFVLGVLTEEGTDPQQRAKEPKRAMGATISLYDLMTKKVGVGVDGIVLVDNQIMVEKFGQDYSAIDDFIHQAMRPFVAGRHYPGEDPPSLAMREKFIEGLDRPPILVPCCWREKRKKDPEDDLAKRALTEGRLFGCDPGKADRAYVFTRGFVDQKGIVSAVARHSGIPAGRIEPWRKLGENHANEILILLRNPYGEERGCEVKGTLEHRLHRVIRMALRYMDDPETNLVSQGMPELTKKAIEDYFYGEDGIRKRFEDALLKIENGERPFFLEERNIFERSIRESHPQQIQQTGRKVDEDEVRKIVEEEVRRALAERGFGAGGDPKRTLQEG